MNTKDFDNKGMNIQYVDAIMIVDNKGKIIYSVRYNPRFNEEENENDFKKIINKHFLEIYPSIDPEKSSINNCIKKGIPIYMEHQALYDYRGNLLNKENLTLPIIRRGKVLGAVELSKDITKIQDLSEKYKQVQNINSYTFSNDYKNKDTVIKFNFDDIITKDPEMLRNIEKCKMIADSISPVLIYGETGTGKELFVQSIHSYSKKRNTPFIAQNCAALPESLFESLLFGTVKGAFTGANDKEGLFEMANGGTLFFDEINSMPLNLQAKLLRVLQDGFVRRIGDSKDKKVDVRIITAMNMPPIEAIKSKTLTEDLFYRLNVMGIKLTPLRRRKDDIPLLIKHFIKKYNELFQCDVEGVNDEVKSLFFKYDWPGNVRELQHVIEASMNILKEGKIGIKHLPVYLNDLVDNGDTDLKMDEDGNKPLNEIVDVLEKKIIIKAIKESGGNVSKASKLLKVPRQTLQYKIEKYEIKV